MVKFTIDEIRYVRADDARKEREMRLDEASAAHPTIPSAVGHMRAV